MSMRVVEWVCAAIAGACFLLSAFGMDALGTVHLVPLGLLFFVIAVVCHHYYPHTVR